MRASMGWSKPCLWMGVAIITVAGAWAQEPVAQSDTARSSNKAVLEEVRVVSTKRATADRAQDVPVAATVITSMAIDENNYFDLVEVARVVPGSDFRETATFPGIQRFWLRAVGVTFSVPNFDPAVGVYQDGVFVAQNIAAILDTFDMESIEVLRGPQGTLFGRNTSVGAVVTRAKRPGETWGIDAQATFGSYDRNDYQVTVGGPLIDGLLRGKLALQNRNRDGWVKDNLGGDDLGVIDTMLARGLLVYTPSDSFDMTLIGERYRRRGDGAISVPLGLDDRGRQNHPLYPGMDRNWDETWSASGTDPWRSFSHHDIDKVILDANWDIEHGVITSVTGYINVDAFSGSDFDGLPPGPSPQNLINLSVVTGVWIGQDQFSQELRYASTFSERFDVTAGLYYFTQDLTYGEVRHANTFVSPTNPFGLRPPGHAKLDHDSYAVFAEGRWHLSDKMALTVGARLSRETKDVKLGLVNSGSCDSRMMPPFETSKEYSCTRGAAPGGWDIVDDETWDSLAARVILDYRATDSTMFYGGWTRGFRSGGFSFRASPVELTAPGIRPSFYDEERVDNLEIGMKADLMDRTLRVNLAAYYQFWDGIQRNLQAGGPSDAIQRTENVDDSYVYGMELEVNWIAADHRT
ncbi:MAG: TonB-dependent receptor [Pseudomonadales bacterium]